ncbi:MAG: hypothetical protein RLZZ480_422 [Candidatus Parcubacteria bacterium]|jgi:hypothetical protein
MTLFDPEKITYFAKTDARGAYVPFGIKAKDRQRHMYVIGKTGMGKSTLLENMAAQDIMNGEGMAFIDPHGSAAEVLLEYVPEHRVNDVVYFAPFDLDNPVAFNVMEDVGPDKRHLVVSGLMSTFKKIWVDAWSARMEYILTNALLALIEYPDSTLLSVNRLFADKAYRDKVVDYVKDPAVKSYWVDEFSSYTDRYIAESVPAIQNKIGQFTGNPLIRNIIGQPKSSFDIRKMMDERKILIMNLSKGLIGETNANLLGSMLTTRIYLAAMSRADLPVDVMKKMPNFYFYVDEFQSFANSTFANILSEARKYHLNLIIAHQYVDQMEEDVRSAVFGNVGTTIAFRVGPFDAEVLETVFAPQFMAVDLVNLGFAQIYLSLMIDGIGSQPFSAVTLPHWPEPPISFKAMAMDSSRKNYAAKREDVEKVVLDLHAVTPPKEGEGAKPAAKKMAPGMAARPLRRPQEEGPRPVVKKVVPAQKSPEELRAILGRLSQDSQPVRPAPVETVSVDTETETVEATSVKVTVEQSKKKVEHTSTTSANVRERRPEPKLARPQQSPNQLPKTVVSRPGAPLPAGVAPLNVKADLKSALAAVLQSIPEQAAAAPAPNPLAERREEKKDEVPAHAEATEQREKAGSAIGQTRQTPPQFEPAPQPVLDPNVVKRMLRDEKQDRSPFS